jgi:hypothetical protein
MRCPECKGNKLVKFGFKFVKNKFSGHREKIQQYQCKKCGRITVKPE